ncbi:MAG: diguanylate phosphodiesterase [Alphaproteobacteria bacterium CG11_big_fil_rev_8_21_14_0_20_39_49]|nr:MAG: diguanylate phosphodiesterase [Alphaproteobacteria bacterium CG11_big_fil_rev_8_21_14_0_20_39_49]
MSKKKSSDSLRCYGDVTPVLEKKIKSSLKSNRMGGLIYISIDNLAMIISSHGGDYTEGLIKGISKKIESFVGESGCVIRSDRNKFSVILSDSPPDVINEKSNEMHKMIQHFGSFDSLEPIHIITTIGSVDFPGNTQEALDAIDKAYVALSDAKKMYSHYCAYENYKNHHVEAKNQMLLANYIQDAFLNNKLRLAFQPIINSKTGDIDYYESLLRIVNEDNSISSAGPFIPIAERMGFIDEIDMMVFDLVVNELEKYPNLKLSVNLSNVTMNSASWLANAQKMLTKDIASRLIVEITETAEASSMHIVANVISVLQSFGCKIALDDFGTGYTSFSQLKSLPVDIIKIDGSFVKDIAINPQSKFFVKTLMEFSKNFNLTSVAEFVESKETADILIEMGVDYLQGNYFSPAVSYRDWMGEEKNIS